MTDTQTRTHPLIGHLTRLVAEDDRAALAALRRGLGRPPGEAPELYPHVAKYFPQETSSRNYENAMFTVAALFGMFPNHRAGAGTPFKVLRQTLGERADTRDSTERRVLSVLNADTEALPTHLRHLFALIRSHGPERHLDFGLLLRHINQWDHPDRWVQRRWAQDWWAWSVPVSVDAEPATGPSDSVTEEVPD